MTLYLGNQIVANSVTVPYNWTGTKAEYDALTTKNPEWVYYITDDTDITLALLQTIYPVGALYFGNMATCPLAPLFGTWQLVATDRVIQGAGTRGGVGTTVNESLPNITGSAEFRNGSYDTIRDTTNSFYKTTSSTSSVPFTTSGNDRNFMNLVFNAHNSSSTYQDNAPVQQNAYLVNIWERIA